MKTINADIIICGASLGGTLAAYSAVREGKRAVLLEKTKWIGGQLTSQAVPPDEHIWIEKQGCTRSYSEYRKSVREYFRNLDGYSEDIKKEEWFCPAFSEVSFLAHPPKLAHKLLSDMLKPYVKQLKEKGKSLFVLLRGANKSASQVQDLMTGSRLVHIAAADSANRLGETLVGRSGYSQIGGIGSANAADSLKTLRGKYKSMFLLVDGYDYSNANAKNCSYAFDKFGHGAIVCACDTIAGAWKEADGADYAASAVAACERMKKNLTRYITIL